MAAVAASVDGTGAMTALRRLRIERLLTIRELAQRAGVAPRTVCLVEAGRTRPSLRVIRQIATVLSVEPQAVEEFRQALRIPPEPGLVEAERQRPGTRPRRRDRSPGGG